MRNTPFLRLLTVLVKADRRCSDNGWDTCSLEVLFLKIQTSCRIQIVYSPSRSDLRMHKEGLLLYIQYISSILACQLALY